MPQNQPDTSTAVGKPERVTQNRVVKLFHDDLEYRYLGSWQKRQNNRNIEASLVAEHLQKVGYSDAQSQAAILKLETEASNQSRSLYENNRQLYSLLRYGVSVKTKAGDPTETIRLIDWEHPENNDFAIAEEVTLEGHNERRPDLVLYLNGIAVVVIELKAAYVTIGDGIRQILSNQSRDFHEWFFTTVQLCIAGNDSEGLRYGTIGTPETWYLRWQEEGEDADGQVGYPLDRDLLHLCRKDKLLELIHDFILFDGGIKKLPRPHQYFAVKESQKWLRKYESGIIWHTQGSGKSIVMVLLAKWLLETIPDARVAVITDRDELDKQIQQVFEAAGEKMHRTSSGRDLMEQLGQATPRLLCSLVHKFGRRGVEDFDAFIKELEAAPRHAVGQLFLFVDECHRTQSGKLHKTMKALLPEAVFVGFTGTPLLRKDRETTFEVFGERYFHTYKFKEAVSDGIILDLVYEARDIEQILGSQEKIDRWFDAKTQGLNDWQKAALRERWGTMQKVLSSRSRMEQIVKDIIFDFSTRPRLSSGRGTAMLVASSIYEAGRYYELFQKTSFAGHCALITSYDPQAGDVSLEAMGTDNETGRQFLYSLYEKILADVAPAPGKSRTESYEDKAKKLFIKEPANMKLLIVVDKLLTGFDAPSCSYLYIDKSMQDHGLFQAICRTNRLDGVDKSYGHIIDYKDLFKMLVNEKGTGALQVYSSDLDQSRDGGPSPDILLQERLKNGRNRLEQAREQCHLLCEPVEPPKDELAHIRYFCGNPEKEKDLQQREPQRTALYKATAAFVRAYANIADDLPQAGYPKEEIEELKQELTQAVKLRDTIRLASGETLDLKAYEADMRHLIDTYIEAKDSFEISSFGEAGLLEVIAQSGLDDIKAKLPGELRKNPGAAAETIANNVRRKIIKKHLNDPAFYDKMSALLKQILEDLRAKRLSYAEFLKKVKEQVIIPILNSGGSELPKELDTPGKKAIYHNLDFLIKSSIVTGKEMTDTRLERALAIDRIVHESRQDDWRGNQGKENQIKEALWHILEHDEKGLDLVFQIVYRQEEY